MRYSLAGGVRRARGGRITLSVSVRDVIWLLITIQAVVFIVLMLWRPDIPLVPPNVHLPYKPYGY